MNATHFLDELSKRARLLMLGGLAVIAHGLSRATKDVDVWLEPLATAAAWTAVLREVLGLFPDARLYDLRERRPIEGGEMERVATRDGVIRITGLDRPVDVFRVPHGLEMEDFQPIWNRAATVAGDVRIPDEIDLLLTKEDTSRPNDIADVAFLEDKVRRRLSRTLPVCSPEEAAALFERYADHATCMAALANPAGSVRDIAIRHLRAFADGGDPFARQVLHEHGLDHFSPPEEPPAV